MTYPIELNILASMYKQGWNGSTKNTYDYDFSEKDLSLLAQHFSPYTPADNVADVLATHLPDLYEEMYQQAVEAAQYNTIYEGTVEQLFEYLHEELEIEPMSIIEADIKKSVFQPGTKQWNLLPDAQLISQWCDLHREQLEHERYTEISRFFEKEFQIYCDFDNDIEVEIRLPQSLYDAIKA